ncbi:MULTISPECIES: head-tail connector protein [Kordiimonas]|jgi:hypothetical protein|uniref:head-tail connector protein n=1 Tax=Kordiimonas TaxID=288021 RepID=UPI00257B236F|nr:head-tail connector protein [Kordiimonas sp. UBA4487]
MRIETLSAPASEPLLLDEIKNHLRLDGSADDVGLGGLLRAAREMVENHLGLCLINRSLALYLDAWPGSMGQMPWWQGVASGSMAAFVRMAEYLPLPVRPVSGIGAIQTYDVDGAATVWDAENYNLKPGLEPALYRTSGSWPTPGRTLDGISIELTTGFGDSWNDVPADIRQALLMLVAHLFENRGDTGTKAMDASGAGAVLKPYRKLQI